jgi:hypothetical protein
MKLSFVELLVAGDPAAARSAIESSLLDRNFRLTCVDDWTTVAERGSKVTNYLSGGWVEYLRIGVRVFSAQPGEMMVRLESQSRGWTGTSLLAMGTANRRMTDELSAIRDQLQANFSGAGTLCGVQDG